MAQRMFHLPSQAVITLSTQSADKLIQSGRAHAALLYLYIARHEGRYDDCQAAKDLGFDGETLADALAALEELGLAVPPAAPKAHPVYPAHVPDTGTVEFAEPREISRLIQGDPAFRHLASEMERRLGRPLTPAELSTLLSMYRDFGIPADVLLIAITHCFEETARKYGSSRLPSIRQIEKEAAFWSQSGITTMERAMSFLRSRDASRVRYVDVAKILRLGSRQLTEREEKYISRWLEMGFPPESIYKAFDITMVNTGKLTWQYMDKILSHWHDKGLHSPAEVESSAGAKHEKPASSQNRQGIFEPGENERIAVQWLKNQGRRNGSDRKAPG